MIDVKRIVKEASATGTCFAPPYHEQRIARHAVALTLRAVAEEIRVEAAEWDKNAQEAAECLEIHNEATDVQAVKVCRDLAERLEAQAAAIEKGGG